MDIKLTPISAASIVCAIAVQAAHSAPPHTSAPSLTLYNDNFAVVRDTLQLTLKPGINQVRYQEITTQLEPDSVIFRPLEKKDQLFVLEQNYHSLPVNESLLLQHYEGEVIDFEVTRNNQTEILSGKIIRSGTSSGVPVIEIDGKTRFGLPGTPLFPALKDDALLKPALNLQLDSATSGKISAELAYLTGGLSWKADYNLVARESSDQLDLSAWVTINNDSGKNFDNAKVKLMAGDFNKIAPQEAQLAQVRMMAAARVKTQITEKDFDDYHLYSIDRPVNLDNGESKQVEFIRASVIKSETRYLYNGAQIDARYPANMEHIRNDPNYGVKSNTKVWIYRQFSNSKDNGLGVSLPKGRVRFYQQDQDKQLEFLGENNIDHTAQGALVSLYTGNAFDISGERTRLNYELHTRENRAQESFEITVKNRKKQAVTVTVIEPLYRWTNWEIVDHSEPFTKTDSQTIEFNLKLKPEQEDTLTYTVNYSW